MLYQVVEITMLRSSEFVLAAVMAGSTVSWEAQEGVCLVVVLDKEDISNLKAW